jgi:plastocyanin
MLFNIQCSVLRRIGHSSDANRHIRGNVTGCGRLVALPQRQFAGGEMLERNESTFKIIIVIIIVAIAISFVALAQAQEVSASLNETEPAKVRIVSTEFKYAPAEVVVSSGRAVTLVLDNSGAETEHGLFLPAFGFRLQVNAGEIARKNILFEKPGEYEFICDLPGHSDAGMRGAVIVVDH